MAARQTSSNLIIYRKDQMSGTSHDPRLILAPSNSQAPIGFEDHINQWADMSYKLISDGFTSLGLTAKASRDDIG